jgi:hypothetical protein
LKKFFVLRKFVMKNWFKKKKLKKSSNFKESGTQLYFIKKTFLSNSKISPQFTLHSEKK